MTPHYAGIIKKTITVFGSLFSQFQIERLNTDGTVGQTINIPIAYSSKQKWLTRIEQDPNLTNHTLTTMPRFGFEITNYSYDSSRKVNSMQKIASSATPTEANTQFSPVPYNIDINLYLQTKNVEDGLMVMEQILPMFTPHYTVTIDAVPDMNIINDVPLVLNGVSVEDDYESDFRTRRSIIHTFSFTLKVNLFGEITRSKLIKHVTANLPDVNGNYQTAATVPGTLTQDQWTFNFGV
jgi:hypothetical protein